MSNGDPLLGMMWHLYHHVFLLTESGPRYNNLLASWQKFNKERGPFGAEVLSGSEDMLGFAAYNELKITDALRHVEKALQLAPAESLNNIFKYKILLALLRHELGDSATAQKEIQESINDLDLKDSSILSSFGLIFLLRLLTCSGKYAEAINNIKACREANNNCRIFYDMINVHVERYAGLCLFYNGNIDDGLRCLEKSMKWAKSNYLIEYVNSAIIYEYYGELAGKSMTIIEPDKLPNENFESEELLNFYILNTYRAMERNNFSEALDKISRIRKIAKSNSLRPWLATCYGFESYIQQNLGNKSKSRRLINMALDTMDKIKWHNYPMASSRVTSFLITSAVRWDLHRTLIEKLMHTINIEDLDKSFAQALTSGELSSGEKASLLKFAISNNIRGLGPIADRTIIESNKTLIRLSKDYIHLQKTAPLPKLTVNALGRFSLMIERRIIEFARSKARDLFIWLLLNHPNGLHEEVILDYFWSGRPHKMAKVNLQTALSSLRKSLDPQFRQFDRSYILYESNHYFLVLPTNSVIDFREFQNLYSEISGISENKPALSVLIDEKIEVAIELYRGDLLPESRFEEFVQLRREELKNQYYHLLDCYINKLLNAREYRRAEELLTNGLSNDSLWANGVRLAMELYYKDGKTLNALKIFRNYEAKLSSELGIRPEKDLQEYYNWLIRS